jgi:hypothetical protein
MEEKELDGIKIWYFVAVLVFAVVCTLIRAAVTEPPKPPDSLPKSAEDWWHEKSNQPPLTDKEVEALVKYLKELE